MFQSARFSLTAWYLAIIMFVSSLFSLIIFAGVNSEYRRFEQIDSLVQERIQKGLPVPRSLLHSHVEPEIIAEARRRLISSLGLINLAIFVFAGGAGYFLAGRTLRPIKRMVDEQHRFIADASHELRTPLTTLRSEIEVGLRNKKLTIKEAKELLESNLEEAVNLQNLTEHLLELAQSDTANAKQHFNTVSLKECFIKGLRRVERLAKKKDIEIQHAIDDVQVFGIEDRLSELFVILLDNAIKYSPEKGSISVTAKKRKNVVKISVADTGYGIEKEDIPHIFDRFYRASKSRSKTKASGYGLGLSIAKKIVSAHNGEISVASETNKGTTFTVRLPAL